MNHGGIPQSQLPGVTNGAAPSIQGILQRFGFSFLSTFFKTWLKLDITTLAAALTIFGTLSVALNKLQGLALKIYWWFTRFFTASISIAGSDRLNREVVNWISSQILEKRGARVLTARTELFLSDAHQMPHRMQPRPDPHRRDFEGGKKVPIQYLPSFNIIWFIYERNLFLVQQDEALQHPKGSALGRSVHPFAAAAEGNEPLLVMCLGRSVEPIKRFFETCRNFAEKQRESFVTVRVPTFRYNNFESWGTTILRPVRPLETVHFDEKTKLELVNDITDYLSPKTRRFYAACGVPYRRGFLLHGPPGTGKTSLTLALAGLFELELYLLHIPSVFADTELARIFTTLPPKCIILLEDIDAVGRSREAKAAEEEEDDDKRRSKRHGLSGNPQSRSMCTLSGLLNVLDGVASQEGRIVIMTSNFADQLDKALIRPGRIDKLILLSYINKESARLMFLRMFARETSNNNDNDNDSDNDDENNKKHTGNETSDEELQNLALQFSNEIPEGQLTPAQLQGYLLNHRTAPKPALAGLPRWVADELAILEKERQAAAEVALAREKRKNKERMKALVQDLIDIRDVGTEDAPELASSSSPSPSPTSTAVHPPTQAAGQQSEDIIIITPTVIAAAAAAASEKGSTTNSEELVITAENSTKEEEEEEKKKEKDHPSEGAIVN